MKVTVLNSVENNPINNIVVEAVINEINNYTIDIDRIDLLDKLIEACGFCYHCWTKTPGLCIIDDAARSITNQMYSSDLVIAITDIQDVEQPKLSKQLKKMFERSIPYSKYGNLLVIGIGNLSCDIASDEIIDNYREKCQKDFADIANRLGIDFRYKKVAHKLVLLDLNMKEAREGIESIENIENIESSKLLTGLQAAITSIL